MKILLNIPDDVAGKYRVEAEQIHRSRKNLMEKVLIDYFQPQIQNLTKPTNEIKTFEQPKTNYFAAMPAAPIKPKKSVEQWVAEKRELVNQEQYQTWFKELEADQWLTSKQKSLIKQA